MATHARKRQFQPSNQTKLDSFFVRDADARSPISPPLPADTQASLLSVGMRVRKSVPEGYKTHKTINLAGGFPFPSSAPSPQRPAYSTPLRPSLSQTTTRELAPFCGLHKTGGWAAQDVPSSAPADLGYTDDDDDMPGLSFSQRTFSASQNTYMGSPEQFCNSAKKRSRTYEDDVEDDMDAFFDEAEAVDAVYRDTARPIAKMKGSALRKSAQSSVVRILDTDDTEDFEEAAFLAPIDGMEVD